MAVTSVQDFAGPFAPDGVTTVFPFDFAALAASEVAVIRLAADETDTVLDNYTVTLNPNGGGTVTFVTPPAVGDPLYIVSNPSFEQQINFANQGKFSAAQLGQALDRAAIRDIALASAVSRALLAPPADTLGVLPSVAVRAGGFLAFDAAGQAVISQGIGVDATLRTDLAGPGGAALIGYSNGQTLAAAIREPLLADRTYYVRPDGSDANTGLANSAAGAFLTYQRAINAAYALDCRGHAVIIQGAAGTYTGQISVAGPLVNPATATPLTIIGDETTPGNVIISTSADAIKVTHGGYLCLKGIRTQTSAGDAWTAETGGIIEHQNCEHGNVAGTCFAPHFYGFIKQIGGTYHCVGDADSFVHATTRGMVRFTGQNWGFTKVGGNSFTTYVFGLNDATCDCDGSTVTGKILAGRTTVHLNAKLNLGSVNMSGLTSSVLGPGALIYAGDAYIALDGWATLNFYVDQVNGSDNNTGITADAWNALQSIAGVVTLLGKLPVDSSTTNAINNSVLIHLADGTYSTVALPDLPNYTSAKIVGNTTTPANTIVSSATDAVTSVARKTTWWVDSLKLTTTAGSSHGLRAEKGVTLLHSNCEFGSCTGAHKFADTGGRILNVGSAGKISGGAAYHAQAKSGGHIDLATVACTTTLVGTPAFSGAFVRGERCAQIVANHNLLTYSGSATGTRHQMVTNAVVDTNGATVDTFLPGNANGTLATGGQYA